MSATRTAIAFATLSVICATPVSAQDIYLGRQKEGQISNMPPETESKS